MNIKIFNFTFILFASIIFGQVKQNNVPNPKAVSENTIYQLFPTENFWTFLKLNTRNGMIWQVHFGVKDTTDGRGTLNLNTTPLVTEEKEVNNRFTLYPSENMYNFLLLDQIDGSVYQVQWSMEEKNRGIVSIL